MLCTCYARVMHVLCTCLILRSDVGCGLGGSKQTRVKAAFFKCEVSGRRHLVYVSVVDVSFTRRSFGRLDLGRRGRRRPRPRHGTSRAASPPDDGKSDANCYYYDGRGAGDGDGDSWDGSGGGGDGDGDRDDYCPSW